MPQLKKLRDASSRDAVTRSDGHKVTRSRTYSLLNGPDLSNLVESSMQFQAVWHLCRASREAEFFPICYETDPFIKEIRPQVRRRDRIG